MEARRVEEGPVRHEQKNYLKDSQETCYPVTCPQATKTDNSHCHQPIRELRAQGKCWRGCCMRSPYTTFHRFQGTAHQSTTHFHIILTGMLQTERFLQTEAA